jgi:hypothetical protein
MSSCYVNELVARYRHQAHCSSQERSHLLTGHRTHWPVKTAAQAGRDTSLGKSVDIGLMERPGVVSEQVAGRWW